VAGLTLLPLDPDNPRRKCQMYEFMIHMIIACVFGVCMGGCIAGWVIIIKKLIGQLMRFGRWIKAKAARES